MKNIKLLETKIFFAFHFLQVIIVIQSLWNKKSKYRQTVCQCRQRFHLMICHHTVMVALKIGESLRGSSSWTIYSKVTRRANFIQVKKIQGTKLVRSITSTDLIFMTLTFETKNNRYISDHNRVLAYISSSVFVTLLINV